MVTAVLVGPGMLQQEHQPTAKQAASLKQGHA